ncbi:hypothetical protein ACG97_02745 [Vogesella sp. EB]|uniref:hypothetical protein n=1 Tax=Vogesella sp. EB TaxID=1526735 RepID=UPI00064CDEAF|nr:hypothetical protein [Vogesella sp. EB]KMJ54668.1 hypothetical protein ACG97_02745 [Vogesella sp. EB]
MDLLHSTWFWIVIIGAPLGTVLGTLARLSQKQPPIELPPGVAPGTYARREQAEQDDDVASR